MGNILNNCTTFETSEQKLVSILHVNGYNRDEQEKSGDEQEKREDEQEKREDEQEKSEDEQERDEDEDEQEAEEKTFTKADLEDLYLKIVLAALKKSSIPVILLDKEDVMSPLYHVNPEIGTFCFYGGIGLFCTWLFIQYSRVD